MTRRPLNPMPQALHWEKAMTEITLAAIKQAAAELADVAITTPMEQTRWLSAIEQGQVLLKCENLQRTGSFKIRGAFIRLSRLTAVERSRGVVAASAGNHAQGVALAASMLDISSTVFMPEGAPIPKYNATLGYGAEVHLQGTDLTQTLQAAMEYAERTGAVFIPLRPCRRDRGAGHPRVGDPRPGARDSHRARAHRRRWTPCRGGGRDQIAAA
jgi:threonine dehydratase